MALTPMMRQYQEVKATLEDTLLMFRLGDFYELFFDDAVVASRVLDITLTGREGGETGRIPMCGVPYHALEQYLERLIEKGLCVAICEQVEDPKTAKGIVRREIVRIVTPGTALSKEQSHRFLASVAQVGRSMGLAFIDVGTGEVFTGVGTEEACANQLRIWDPIEILADKSWQTPSLVEALIAEQSILVTRRAFHNSGAIERQYDVASSAALGVATGTAAYQALDQALQYIETTQKMTLRHLQDPQPLFEQTHLTLNQTAMNHLELLTTARDHARKGSLFDLLDQTVTAAGSRTLRAWMERPLCEQSAIFRRHEVVDYFVQDLILREEVRGSLRGVHDLARIVARFAFRNASARDLLALSKSLANAAMVVEALQAQRMPPLLEDAIAGLPNVTELREEIDRQIVDEPPATTRDGGMFRTGMHEELDRLRALQTSGRTWLRDLEANERERTGIKSLKIGYNKVFGYYIEVSKANLPSVPDRYERRQTLASAERFILPELKEREADILSAQDRATAYEAELFEQFCEQILEHGAQIQHWADVLAQIDAFASLAHVAMERRYVRPDMREACGIDIEEGRHPVVETLRAGAFVPNDTALDPENPIILLTGPNMGGKSTYMRQTAIICIMAQMGGFVPAKRAVIGIVDQIFARIGAADDLGRGQSTFMVEMIELAEILRQATGRSLVLLDEIGRGTSTYDGLSIAEAVLEELVTRTDSPLTMFATHYHELIQFSNHFERVRNHSMAVAEQAGHITFLHTVVTRPSDRSYGIQVARLAGLPASVILRAAALLQAREEGVSAQPEIAATALDVGVPVPPVPPPATELALFFGPYQSLVEWIAAQDVMTMTPLAAMNRLHEVIEKARELSQWETSN